MSNDNQSGAAPSAQKSHADLIAEMRWQAKQPVIASGGEVFHPVDESDILDFAKELDAAHKREMATAEKSSAVGNAAKLREALMYAEQVLDTAARNVRGETGMVINSAYSEAARKCRAALAAPPRNCDNYATDDKAIAFFADEALLEEWEALKLGKDRDMLATELFSFIRWLFATATEEAKEGENK